MATTTKKADPALTKRIDALKVAARDSYLQHQHLVHAADASCGLNLLALINPEIARAARDFNTAMDQLAVIDKSFPKTFNRLPEGE